MCKVSKEAVIRANNSTRNKATSPSTPVVSGTMNVSVRHNGNIYSKQISLSQAKISFGKAMIAYGKKL